VVVGCGWGGRAVVLNNSTDAGWEDTARIDPDPGLIQQSVRISEMKW